MMSVTSFKALLQREKYNSRRVINAFILHNYFKDSLAPRTQGEMEIASVLKVRAMKIHRVKQRFVEDGLDVALNGHESERVYNRKADGDSEGHPTALICS